jgi:3'-phosphoadenosine 5'-phosphosulfate sulfotransferase (PAPS reductase)/FAD synthetase
MLERDENGIAHIVGLSGGKDSTCLALWLAENEPRPYNYVCTPTQDELPDMVAHWQALEQRLGRPLLMLENEGLVPLNARMKCLPNFEKRFCTRILKLKPYGEFIKNAAPAISYIGLRDDEDDREGARTGGDYAPVGTDVLQRFPLREIGFQLEDVQQFLMERQIIIPARTDCARCPMQRLGEWYNLYIQYPAIYADAEAEEIAIGHTYRSPSRDTWPASLADLRKEFERGRIPTRSLNMMEKRKGMCRVCTL